MTQKFLPVGKYSLSDQPIPEFKYFILHPALNEEMKKYHQNDFYDSTNIIGYNYPFLVNEKVRRTKHLHFGLDRDDVSILIPELNKSKTLAVIQLPCQEWSELCSHNRVSFDYSNSIGGSC